MTNPIPNPGSPDAVARGCTCSVEDNRRGAGAADPRVEFWVDPDCPLHGAGWVIPVEENE